MNLVKEHQLVSVACSPVILHLSVLPIISVKNVEGHTIRYCTHCSSAMAWLKELVDIPNNKCQQQMTLLQVIALACPAQIWWTAKHAYDDLSDHSGDFKWSCNKSTSVAQLHVIHIIHHRAFNTVTAIVSSAPACSSSWHWRP